jgi:hypothetical protein
MDTAAADEAMTNLNRVSKQLNGYPLMALHLRYVGELDDNSLRSIKNETVIGWYRDRLSIISAVSSSDKDSAYAVRAMESI